jgi:hypothetical protein
MLAHRCRFFNLGESPERYRNPQRSQQDRSGKYRKGPTGGIQEKCSFRTHGVVNANGGTAILSNMDG